MNNTDKTGYIYLLASKEGGALYLGVTSDLIKRIAEHLARFISALGAIITTASVYGKLPLGSA